MERVHFATAIPLAGLLVSGFIWLNLGRSAQLLGFGWIAVGLSLYWIRRRFAGGSHEQAVD